MGSSSPRYHAYLLRIWLSNSTTHDACWQASLQDASGSQRIGFASLEALFVFLMNEVGDATNVSQQEQEPREHDRP